MQPHTGEMGERWYVQRHDQETGYRNISPLLTSESACFAWLHRHQGQSVDHALRYEEYRYSRQPDVPVTRIAASELVPGDVVRTEGVEARLERIEAHPQLPANLMAYSSDWPRGGYVYFRITETVTIVDRHEYGRE